MGFNENSIEKLKLKTFELDKKLELLYNFIEVKYPNHTVTIFADHGHAFLSKEPHILSHYRTSVPWLVRSSKMIDHNKYDTLFTSNIDILPTLVDLCNLTYNNSEFDGKSIFNKSINDKFIIESIYPNKTVHFKIFKNKKFENLNTRIIVDNFGFMTMYKEKNYQLNIDIEKIINN